MPAALIASAPRLQQRSASVQPDTWDAAARTVEVVWAAGAIVRRRDPWTGGGYDEELIVSNEAIDMSRFAAGTVQVLDGHDRYSGVRAIIGIAERAWIARGEARALLRLSDRPELAGIVADIGNGLIKGISVGYSADAVERLPAESRADGVTDAPLWRITRWTPHEISFVAVPADPNTGTRSLPAPNINHPEERTMPSTPALAPERDTAAEIIDLCTRHGVAELAAGLVRAGNTIEQARAAVLNELALRDAAAGGHVNVRPMPHGPARDDADHLTLMTEALSVRMGAAPTQPQAFGVNPFRNARVSDMAREILERAGTRTTSMSQEQLIERGLHSTSDFPALLQGAGNRVLRDGYEAYEGGIRRIARQASARDFRAKQSISLGEWPKLLPVAEGGEFKHGTMAEATEAYTLTTWGRIFGITRQALLNDDLAAFGTMAARVGRAAAETEATVLAALLTGNPTMSDSKALFHTDHGNLATGGGSALDMTALSTARKAMRLQKGLDGQTIIDVTPVYLVVPAALETVAEQLVATLQPGAITSVNPFAGKLQVVVDPRLDASSVTAWYLAASQAQIDTIEYSYLEGSSGPQLITREGFEVDGLELKARLDFGAGVLDWRGLYKAAGA